MNVHEDRADKLKSNLPDLPEKSDIEPKSRRNVVAEHSGSLGISEDVTLDNKFDESEMTIHPIGDDISGDSLEVYFRGIGKSKLLTRDEEYALAKGIQSGDVDARDKLVTANMRLVASIAKRYTNLGLDLHDLMQEGATGLMTAANRFDPSLGFKFSTYATHWIRQAVTRAVSDKGNTIRRPVHFNERLMKIRRVQNQLSQDLKRQPSMKEVAEAVDMEVGKVRDTIGRDAIVGSLDVPVSLDDSETMLVDFIEDENASKYVEDIDRSIVHEQLMEGLSSLSDRERQILLMRFGLHPDKDPRDHTLEEVSKEFGVTRERIRQIEAKSFSKLRKNPRMAKLISYIR